MSAVFEKIPIAGATALWLLVPALSAGQDLSTVRPIEWATAFAEFGEETPYPVWELFEGGCPAGDRWRAEALESLLTADLDEARQFTLATMMTFGMERCEDRSVAAWMIGRLRTLSRRDEEGFLPAYLTLLRDSELIWRNPALVNMMLDPSLDDGTRSRFGFAIQNVMSPQDRENFLMSVLGQPSVPKEWSAATALRLLRERGDGFVTRISAELLRDPTAALNSTVIETLVENLRYSDSFPTSDQGVRALRNALADVASEARLSSATRAAAARLAAGLPEN